MFRLKRFTGIGAALLLAMLVSLSCRQSHSRQEKLAIASPEELAFSPSRLQAMQKNMQRYVDEQKLAGFTALVARRGKIVHLESYGQADIENQRPMKKNSICQLASLTKPIVSVALMKLVEEGQINLHDPVSKYLPAFRNTQVMTDDGKFVPASRPISVRDVLMHTSGLSAHGFAGPALNKIYASSELADAESLAEFVDELSKLPLKHQPGAGWSYGYSTDVVGRLVEVVSRQPLEQFIERQILQPLGMHDTGFSVPDEKGDRLAIVYSGSGESGLVRKDRPMARFTRGWNGMVSTVEDYYQFTRMLLNGGDLDGVRILQPETVAEMARNGLAPEITPISVMDFRFTNNGFGLGFSVVVSPDSESENTKNPQGAWWNRGAPPEDAYWWIGGTMTYFWVDPQNEIIGIFFTQSADGMQQPFLQEFHELVYAAFDGNAPETEVSLQRFGKQSP